MNQSYKATLSQYALPQFLPTWGGQGGVIWGDLEGWSRDPMFEKYPSISPYTYCANNPVKYLDPDGRKFVVPRVRIEGQKGRYNVTFDGTTATMQQAGRKSSGETFQYQAGTNQFVDNMIASYNYITNCEGADVDGAMQKMAASDIVIKVVQIANTAEYSDGKIKMDFSKGSKVDRDDGKSGYQSPALGFWAEVYHSFIDKLDMNAKNTYQDKNNREREENYVHILKEGAVIDALKTKNPSNGETKRGKYEDAWKVVRIKNVTDTEP
ncbi:MAG: hypothetical protein KBA86_06785 [Bacteroidales bacterium]|nr:hypothetical protein [Bacteroidales bacterium]